MLSDAMADDEAADTEKIFLQKALLGEIRAAVFADEDDEETEEL
jgi:hypothetical protein